jgi:hypothetical protein
MAATATPQTPPRWVPPDWSGDPAPHVEQLRSYAEAIIENELSWYYRKKKGRSSVSRWLRFIALVLTVLGGLVPLLIAVFEAPPDWPWLSWAAGLRFGQVGYVLLALAGGLVLLDKYFGFSTGWMRYIVAMQAIEKARESFRLDWIGLRRAFANTQPQTAEQAEVIERMILRARSVILEVKEHSEKETQAWILEFQTNLAQFEKDVKSQMEASKPGGIDVEVVDGNKADSPIELALDGMIADRFVGTAGSIGFVAPGLHRVSARARKGDRDYSASALVNIGPGQICPVKLTLKIP